MADEARELELRERLAAGGLSEPEELAIREELASMTQKAQDMPGSNLLRAFNTGVQNLTLLPLDVYNLTGQALGGESGPLFQTDIPAKAREGGALSGMTNRPGENNTVLERSLEFFGGSVLGIGALSAYGNTVMNTTMPHMRTFLQRMAADTASKMGMTLGTEFVSSVGAATGGRLAERFTDNPWAIALAELGGGIAPDAYMTLSPAAIAVRQSGSIRPQVTLPTQGGASITVSANTASRAANRLQSLTADPMAAAGRIDPASPVPPGRQTREPDLMRLEQTIIQSDPARRARYSEELQNEIVALQNESRMFSGDAAPARRTLQQDADYAIRMMSTRAKMAAEDAANALNALDPNATQREISTAARPHLEQALTEARAQESALWNQVERNAPAKLDNSRQVVNDFLAARSSDANPDDVPGWVRERFATELPEELQGLTGPMRESALQSVRMGQQIPEEVANLVDLRHRALAELRSLRAQPGYNRTRARLLTDLQEALLRDLEATGAAGVDAARAFSRALNDRFTRGNVGRILAFERRGGSAVAPADTLDQILSGRTGAVLDDLFAPPGELNEAAQRELQQFRDGFLDYLKSRYLGAINDSGTINTRRANRFVEKLDSAGVFEHFPELRGQLVTTGSLQDAANQLRVGRDQLSAFLRNDSRSALTLFLNASPGEEMNALLTSSDPTAAARRIRQRTAMLSQNDPVVMEGLRQAYVDELWDMSRKGTPDADGVLPFNGQQFHALLNQTQGAARALGITDEQLGRLNRIANEFRNAQAGAERPFRQIMTDKPVTLLRRTAQLIGVSVAHFISRRMPVGLGGGLVLAEAGSDEAQKFLGSLTISKAERLLIDAAFDPVLYRALLVHEGMGVRRKRIAFDTLDAWSLGVIAPIAEESEQQQ